MYTFLQVCETACMITIFLPVWLYISTLGDFKECFTMFFPSCVEHGALVAFFKLVIACNGPGSTWFGVLGCAQCAPYQLHSTKDSASLKLRSHRFIFVTSPSKISSLVFVAFIPRIPRCEEARRIVISDPWCLCAECRYYFAFFWT